MKTLENWGNNRQSQIASASAIVACLAVLTLCLLDYVHGKKQAIIASRPGLVTMKEQNTHDSSSRPLKAQSSATKDKWQQFLVALSNSNIVLIKALLKQGINPNRSIYGQSYPLVEAVKKGSSDIVKLLLDRGAKPNIQDSLGRSPLWWAASAGDVNSVRLLLAHGANIEAKDYNGDTPLIEAAYLGHNMVVRILLENGANIEANHGKALILASQNAQTPLVRFLLAHGADIEAGTGGYTALMAAAERGNALTVKCLLEHGANANIKDDSGDTPLDLAELYQYTEVVNLLKKAMARQK